ncbi:hypothetical protein RYA99_08610 [Pseudomonas syringae pv. actinidifoliorum]|nr:hypothetical protein [Pseudomonas syringae pv. actinidifoliorum]MDU8524364.1 hypothetical protein [Pseudomonas syringae pv. actinidifoliorum]MDU8526232.1 hypothetical protein [Pseudomonas syringae pv. actinidifoliorum]
MALHTLTIAPHQLEFQLPGNSPITDIEWEAGGKNVPPWAAASGPTCFIKANNP